LPAGAEEMPPAVRRLNFLSPRAPSGTTTMAKAETEKMALKKYDPVAKKHVEFKETKIK
jgi:hypothetical protein